MKYIYFVFIVFACWMPSSRADADIVVIVNPANLTAISERDIARIFLGKSLSFSNGSKVTPYYLYSESPVRTKFDSDVLNKTAPQLKAYWSKRLFSGKGVPPEEMKSAAEMKARIASDPDAIGYIRSEAVDDTVRVVAAF